MRKKTPTPKPLTVSDLARLGGQARAETLTPEHQRAASRARWGNPDRCPCGAMTASRAAARHHKCLPPPPS